MGRHFRKTFWRRHYRRWLPSDSPLETYTYTPSGAAPLTFAGTAPIVRTIVYVPSGAAPLTFAGVAPIVRTIVYAPSGAAPLTFAGAAAVARTFAYTPSGAAPLTLAGSAAVARTFAYTPSGAAPLTFAGAAATEYVPAGTQTFTYTPTGGIVFGGAAATEYSASPPPAASGATPAITNLLLGQPRRKRKRPGRLIYEVSPAGGVSWGGAAATSFESGVRGQGTGGGKNMSREIIERRRRANEEALLLALCL